MAKRRSSEDMTGATFADLYDAQQEMSQRATKPMGRPRNKIKRKPTTVHLTNEEAKILRRLHLVINEHVSSVNKSQIMGMAIELMSELIATHNEDDALFDDIRNAETLKQRLKDLLV